MPLRPSAHAHRGCTSSTRRRITRPRVHWQARRSLRTTERSARTRRRCLGLICGVRAIPRGTSRASKPAGGLLQHSVGVSLALSELCQEGDHFGGGRIPLSAILDLSKPSSPNFLLGHLGPCSDPLAIDIVNVVRQHQSAFVPLGPHVEIDVPKRLVQLVGPRWILYFSITKGGLLTRVPTCSHFIGQRGRCLF